MTEKLESEVQGMCNISEGLVRKSRKEGEVNNRTETIKNMISKGKTPEEISDWCGYDLDFVREVAEGKLQTV